MAHQLDERSPKAEASALHTPDNAKSRRRLTSKPILALLTLIFLTATFSCFYRIGNPFHQKSIPSFSGNDNSRWHIIKDPNPDLHDPIEPFEPLKRYSLTYGKVACWQNGGVWIKELTPVEMSSLGVDRFQDSERALEQADEDAFCTRLRAYGASFWELPPQWPEHVNWCEAIDDCVPPAKKVNFEVGFPTSGGGVWVLDTSQGWERLFPKSLGLRNVLTMDERCEVIKDLGGHFCESTQVCTEMARLLES